MYYNPRPSILPKGKLMLAPVKKRAVAFLLDWIVLIAIYLLLILLFDLFGMSISKVNVQGIFEVEVEMENSSSFTIALLKIFFGLLPFLYFSLSIYYWRGQTPGKYLLGLRVISLYHQHLGWWHSIERSLGYFASVLEFGLGFVQVFWNPNRMTLHDKIGETIVIQLPAKKRK